MKLFEILQENNFPLSNSLNFNERAAWIRPDGKVYNFGETGHSEIYSVEDTDPYFPKNVEEIPDEMWDTHTPDETDEMMFVPLYTAGWVRVMIYDDEFGASGNAKALKNLWIKHLTKNQKLFSEISFDVYNGNKLVNSKGFTLPQQRRELIQFISQL